MTFEDNFKNINMNYNTGSCYSFIPAFNTFPMFTNISESIFAFDFGKMFQQSENNNSSCTNPFILNFNNLSLDSQQYNQMQSWSLPGNFTSTLISAPSFTPSFTPSQSFGYSFQTNSQISANKQNRKFSTYSTKTNGKIDNSYLTLSKSQAYTKALTDSNLEKLTGGSNWTVSKGSFITDIPFAKKGTSAILDKVGAEVGTTLVVTSALGTGHPDNPHQKKGYSSHHNAENPKIDLSTKGIKDVDKFAQKLKDTGYFSRVSIESDHLDVQIALDKYDKLETIA